MKRFFLLALFFVANCFAAHVAVLETIRADENLDNRECQFLTDKLRQMAVTSLPASDGWTIMTRENISEMLPPGKSVEECEGSCLVETGKNISADYVAQGRVSHFGSLLTITVELYETATGKLVSSFAVQSENAEGLLKEIESHAQPLFQTIAKPSQANVENEPQDAANTQNAASTQNESNNTAETTEGKSKKLHSFNAVMPIGIDTWDDRGSHLGAELNWSFYMIKETGFSHLFSVTAGYIHAKRQRYDYDGMDLDLRYGIGYVPFSDSFILGFYGLVGANIRYLFAGEDAEFEREGDKIEYNIILGSSIIVGYQVSERLGILGGINITADMWNQQFYGNDDDGAFVSLNIEPFIGLSLVF